MLNINECGLRNPARKYGCGRDQGFDEGLSQHIQVAM
jgi:hypothetical protein